jgi:hypothetical protein
MKQFKPAPNKTQTFSTWSKIMFAQCITPKWFNITSYCLAWDGGSLVGYIKAPDSICQNDIHLRLYWGPKYQLYAGIDKISDGATCMHFLSHVVPNTTLLLFGSLRLTKSSLPSWARLWPVLESTSPGTWTNLADPSQPLAFTMISAAVSCCCYCSPAAGHCAVMPLLPSLLEQRRHDGLCRSSSSSSQHNDIIFTRALNSKK